MNTPHFLTIKGVEVNAGQTASFHCTVNGRKRDNFRLWLQVRSLIIFDRLFTAFSWIKHLFHFINSLKIWKKKSTGLLNPIPQFSFRNFPQWLGGLQTNRLLVCATHLLALILQIRTSIKRTSLDIMFFTTHEFLCCFYNLDIWTLSGVYHTQSGRDTAVSTWSVGARRRVKVLCQTLRHFNKHILISTGAGKQTQNEVPRRH